MMAKIKIDTDELICSMENHSDYMSYYLNKETGEIITISEELDLIEDEEINEKIDEEPERFIYIEPIDSSESFRIMEDFIFKLPDGKAKNQLEYAISKSKPFRRFKDKLYEYPDIREMWYKFHAQEMKKEANEWLLDNKIEAELLPLPY